MDWIFYWGSVALAAAVTLQLTDRRHWLTGHLFLFAGLSFIWVAYRHLNEQPSPLWQFFLVGVKVAAYGLFPLVVLIVGISFIRYSYRLIRKEGWLFHYSLLALVGAVMVGMLALSALNLSRWHSTKLWQVLGLAVVLTVYFTFSFFAYLVACLTTRLGRRHQIDEIIVLGAGLMPDGQPTPTLRYRLNTAAKYYRKQRAKYHHPMTIVVSGGQGSDEVMAESTAMRQYLVSQGIPRDAIQEEDQSTTTFENLRFSHQLIVRRHPFYRAVFVTSNYHVLRANIFARQLHLNLRGIGAPTPWYYLPFAMFREYLALILLYRWPNLGIVVALSSWYVLLFLKIV
ncbi:YdcF family protein [Lactiplantibacillus modestisalitolerans]|uniref:YdcF family protein n=1 Tax=Lactiplantibacillus modestisalitolerans TaxID=1457219 RepID=A0ABV5WXS4_9LACO|nr:YdcF family protein [Lactiplantibacillus modestisalitolerans]